MDDRDEPDGEAERDPELPESLGHYSILSELGRGGQGQVLLAHDTHLDRRVAIKILPPTVGFRHGERFKREAGLASRLDHPGICPIYDAGELEGTSFIAMRYVEGDTLAELIAHERDNKTTESSSIGPSSRADLQGTLRLFEATARALHAAHEAGLVHRDIKPGNIMVDPQGNPVIVDFGLAHDETSEAHEQQLTFEGDLLGTPAYMSPEQLLAQRIRLDRRTDIYSLGVTLFECLTLQVPFEAPTREGLYKQILTSEIPDPTRINRQLSKDLKVVIETACDKDRDRRYQTAEALAEDLRRVREFKPIHARPMGALLRFRRWTQRRPAVATAVFALFLLLAVGLGISLMALEEVRDREAETRETAQYARSLALAAESQEAVEGSPYLALLLAREAVAARENVRTRSALLESLAKVREVALIPFERARSGFSVKLPGDRVLVCGVGGKTVRVCDFDGQELARYEHTQRVAGLYASPDGARFVTRGYGDDELFLWQLGQSDPMHIEGGQAGSHVHFSSDGDRVLVRNRETSLLFDAEGRFLADLKARYAIADPKLGRILTYSGDDETEAWIFDWSGEEVAHLPARTLTASPGIDLVLSLSGTDARTYGLHSPDGETIGSWEATSARIMPTDPPRFVTTKDKRSTIHDEDGAVVAELPGEVAWMYPVPASATLPGILTYQASASKARIRNADGEELAVFTLSGRPSYCYATDDRMLLPVSGRKQLRDLSGKLLQDDLPNATFFRGPDHLTGTRSNTLHIWNRDGVEIAACTGHDGYIYFQALSDDGTRVMTSSNDGTVRVWDLASTPVPALLGHGAPVAEGAFLDGGERVVTRGHAPGRPVAGTAYHGEPRVFDRTGRSVAVLRHDDAAGASVDSRPTLMVVDATGKRVLTASYSGDTARLWDSDGHLVSDFGNAKAYAADFLGDGRIVTYTRPDGEHTGATLWDRNGRSPVVLGPWKKKAGRQFRPRSSPGVDRFITMTDEPGRAQLVDRNGRTVAALDHAGLALRTHDERPQIRGWFLPNGNIAMLTEDETARVVTLFDHDGRKITEPARYEGDARVVASTEVDRIVSWQVGQTRMDLWNGAGTRVGTLEHDDPVKDVMFTEGANRILAVSEGGLMRVFDQDGAHVGDVDDVSALPLEVVYTAEKDRLIPRLGGHTVPIWDRDCNVLAELHGHTRAVVDVALSPDGTLVATASVDGKVRLWTLGGEPVQVIRGFGSVRSVTFSPDGKTLLATYGDHTSRLWPIDFETARRLADEAAYRGFLPDERVRYEDLLSR